MGDGWGFGLWGLLWKVWPEHQWVLQWVTASDHKDVMRKPWETKSQFQPRCCQPDVELWRGNCIITCPSFMPNLKLTGRTSELFWSEGQEVSKLLMICNLLQDHPERSKRSKFVQWNISSSPVFSQTFPSLTIYSTHSLFPALHLLNTLTSFMTFVKLLLTVSHFCCLHRGAAGWANKGCMWFWCLVDFFPLPGTLSIWWKNSESNSKE